MSEFAMLGSVARHVGFQGLTEVSARARLTIANVAWTYRIGCVPGATIEKVGNDMTIPARYENGIFRPLEEVTIEEGTVVEVHVPGSEPPRGRRSIKGLAFYGL